MAKVEGHEGVTIINTIEFAAFHELLNIVLHNWCLVDGSSLGSCGVNTNAISESKNVLEAFVLEGVWVDINDTFTVGNL